MALAAHHPLQRKLPSRPDSDSSDDEGGNARPTLSKQPLGKTTLTPNSKGSPRGGGYSSPNQPTPTSTSSPYTLTSHGSSSSMTRGASYSSITSSCGGGGTTVGGGAGVRQLGGRASDRQRTVVKVSASTSSPSSHTTSTSTMITSTTPTHPTTTSNVITTTSSSSKVTTSVATPSAKPTTTTAAAATTSAAASSFRSSGSIASSSSSFAKKIVSTSEPGSDDGAVLRLDSMKSVESVQSDSDEEEGGGNLRASLQKLQFSSDSKTKSNALTKLSGKMLHADDEDDSDDSDSSDETDSTAQHMSVKSISASSPTVKRGFNAPRHGVLTLKKTSGSRLPTEAEVEAEENNEDAIHEMLSGVEAEMEEKVLLNCCQVSTTIAIRVKSLVWLTELTCHSNGLTALPLAICEMPNLMILNVTSNNLTTLPSEICGLKALHTLDLNHNKINSLPKSMIQLTNLRIVTLDFNELTEVPMKELAIPELQELHVPENPKIRYLPSVSYLGQYKKLTLWVNNCPSMVREYQTVAHLFPTLTIQWNKVYPDRILDFLYLGSLRSAQDLQVYEELGIKYVLTCGRGLNIVVGDDMHHLVVDVSDMVDESIVHTFDEGMAFIETAKTSGKKILVHCFAGISRSSSLVCAYLMKTKRWTFDETLAFVRQNRPIAQPNDGFQVQLRAFQRDLKIPDKPK